MDIYSVRRFLYLAVLLSLLLSAPVRAATLTVALDGSGQYARIQDAVNAAQSGDTVLVGDGTYAGGLLTSLAAGAALLAAGCGVSHAYYAPPPPVVVVHHYGSGYGYGGAPTVVHVHHYGSGYGGHTVVVHHYH